MTIAQFELQTAMRKALFTFFGLTVVSVSHANITVLCLALPDLCREKVVTRTMTFSSIENWTDQYITGIEVYSPIPPSTGTQDGLGCSIQIIPQSGEKIPASSLEEKDEPFYVGGGKEMGQFMQWTRQPGDPAFKGGFKVVVTQKADLYRYLGLPKETPETTPGVFKPTGMADFKTPIVMEWGNTISPLPAEDSALGIAAGVMKAIHNSIRYTGEVNDLQTLADVEQRRKDPNPVMGEISIQRASKVLKSQGGDCGSFCNLFQAGMLGSGYSARSVVGWNLASTPIARHARSEVMARGTWVPVDATFAHGVDPLTCIGTGQYVQSESFFTNHLGLGVYTAFKDRAGNTHQLESANLQRPYIKVRVASKINEGKEVYMVPAPWVVSIK